MYVLGFDIGGTKCAVITAKWDGENIELLEQLKEEGYQALFISSGAGLPKMMNIQGENLGSIRVYDGYTDYVDVKFDSKEVLINKGYENKITKEICLNDYVEAPVNSNVFITSGLLLSLISYIFTFVNK